MFDLLEIIQIKEEIIKKQSNLIKKLASENTEQENLINEFMKDQFYDRELKGR